MTIAQQYINAQENDITLYEQSLREKQSTALALRIRNNDSDIIDFHALDNLVQSVFAGVYFDIDVVAKNSSIGNRQF